MARASARGAIASPAGRRDVHPLLTGSVDRTASVASFERDLVTPQRHDAVFTARQPVNPPEIDSDVVVGIAREHVRSAQLVTCARVARFGGPEIMLGGWGILVGLDIERQRSGTIL